MKNYIQCLDERIIELQENLAPRWRKQQRELDEGAIAEFKGQYAQLTGTPYDPSDPKDYEATLEYCV